jgi:hypothetical protein
MQEYLVNWLAYRGHIRSALALYFVLSTLDLPWQYRLWKHRREVAGSGLQGPGRR